MRFVVDMNLSPEWVRVLEGAGHEAVHWSNVGPRNAHDDVILEYARVRSSVVFTHDLDFGASLAFSGAVLPSVLQIREQNVDPSVIGPVVIRAIEQCRTVLEQGALVTVDLRRAKARILPIRRTEQA